MRDPSQIYAVYDFWHTSPNFFLIRVGLLLAILSVTYAWCRWGAGQWGFSPLIQLGQTSLLVYWVHIEFVYGRLSIVPKHAVEHSDGIVWAAGDFSRHAAAVDLADAVETDGAERMAWIIARLAAKDRSVDPRAVAYSSVADASRTLATLCR